MKPFGAMLLAGAVLALASCTSTVEPEHTIAELRDAPDSVVPDSNPELAARIASIYLEGHAAVDRV